MEMDWKEILIFSQKELNKAEKEKLCESLSWMEADDIELNFTDLKTLFRLAQDLIKYKTEQVNSTVGNLEKIKSKRKIKTKDKSTITESPPLSSDTIFDTIAHQEEVIKANKDILEQLYADIAELEQRKTQHYDGEISKDQESESSRGTLSELNSIAQLENEVTKRNRHIRKLHADVKILEEENTTLKEKLTIFKDKLKEATLLIENLTEQLFAFNSEHTNLKELLARVEEEKTKLAIEINMLKNDVNKNNSIYEKSGADLKSKLQYFKEELKSYKYKINQLSTENNELKERLQKPKLEESPKKSIFEEIKVKELQDKLRDASEEMIKSANLIQMLTDENNRLKIVIEDMPENSASEHKNESDDGKEKNMIYKLKKRNKNLSIALQDAETMLNLREKELAEISIQLKLLSSDEGIHSLIEGIKNKKRHLKIKDEGIKSLVQEVNTLSQLVSELQLENATMRKDLQLPVNEKIATHGILRTYKNLEVANADLTKKVQEYENKLITLEIDYYDKKSQLQQLKSVMTTTETNVLNEHKDENSTFSTVQAIIEENEGLRNGLTEILTFIKDNSSTSGILSMECPSLEAILNSMEARKLAGWFSPHMKTVMELKAAVGGKDSLMTALHESRKETFQIMRRLIEEEQKSSELEKTILKIEEGTKIKKKTHDKISSTADLSVGEFGSWMSKDAFEKVDFNDGYLIQDILLKGNILFENRFIEALQYFQNKFTILFDKLTTLSVTAEDDFNKWFIKEEQYKAEIENLKSQIDENDDDISNHSPGLLTTSKLNFTDRKYNFLAESFKQIRTLNENIRNEYLESKKERMIESFEYETKVQNLIVSVLNLSDKLRNSVPVELFLKQNETLNQIIIKYRNIVDTEKVMHIQTLDLLKRLEKDKLDLISRFQRDFQDSTINGFHQPNKVFSNVEQSILQKQVEQLCFELNKKNGDINTLKKTLLDLQTSQSQLMDNMLSNETVDEVNFIKKQVSTLKEENELLKNQQKFVQNENEILLLQLKGYEQGKLNNDIEVNMLRHQILDLQSVGDNKAIIARLSGEVLLAQIQTSESYEKIETLKRGLHKEKQLRAETEEMLFNCKKTFDNYSMKSGRQLRSMNNIVEGLRHQYAGSLPLISVEYYLSKVEELQHKSNEIDEKLHEIEDLRLNLMTKHSIYTQILDVSNAKCFEDEDNCPHKLQNIIMEKTKKIESDSNNKKILSVEQSNKNLLERCDLLERTLILVSQGFKNINIEHGNSVNQKENGDIEVHDVEPNDETSKGSLTYTLPDHKSEIPIIKDIKDTQIKADNSSIVIPNKTFIPANVLENRQTQTDLCSKATDVKSIQTNIDSDNKLIELNIQVNKLLNDNRDKDKIVEQVNIKFSRQAEELVHLNRENNELNNKLQIMSNAISEKNKICKNLEAINDSLRNELNSIKVKHITQTQAADVVYAENQDLIDKLKKIESDNNDIIIEYKELLKKERQEYLQSIENLQHKLSVLQAEVDGRKRNTANNDIITETASKKYTLKITDLENKTFKLQSDLEGYKTDLQNQNSESERWRDLASERLIKMEQLSAQLKERHNHEIESYKAENQHWLLQLNETQREHMELRSRLTEQKAFHVKQLAEKDANIEQLRSAVNNLKTQVLNMQTMLTINDPSFDLSAIVEVDEVSDAASQQGSDRLELKFESTVDLNEMQDDFVRMPSSSTAIWQEPLIERLRREKQLVGKQNAILRRQIKVLAARERRSRLDAQNLKNQVFRITSGTKVPSAESAALQNKIASLQTQLSSARRDAHSSVALWDKWKRAQQLSERWQTKFEEKCQEVKKVEMSLNLAKSAITRLEKEKRVLLLRLGEIKHEKTLTLEKQDAEAPEKVLSRSEDCFSPSPVSSRALLERIEAQQRRIVALELAEMGNETLVSEYEKCLAEITSLKGQVLKLESTLLEAQIKSPLKPSDDNKPELEYWTTYCDMLKEENMQLTLRVNSLETTPTSASQQRIADLEQTVLTLRGLVSKLQAEQKAGVRRSDTRPSSGRSGSEKVRSQVESYRIEISNLKKSILEKDALLESSKEMLKIAAEREDELLRENTLLQRRLEQLTENRGFMSA